MQSEPPAQPSGFRPSGLSWRLRRQGRSLRPKIGGKMKEGIKEEVVYGVEMHEMSKWSDFDQHFEGFSVVLLASHPTGDLLGVLDFQFLYFYRFHGSCWASGLLGFFLTFSTVRLKSVLAPGQCAAWIFFAKVITAGLSILLFDVILTSATVGCLLLGGLGEALLVLLERKGT
ncbi:UDP-N-acetylglucosamine transporter TMEM241-like [Rhynchonycteris naso]